MANSGGTYILYVINGTLALAKQGDATVASASSFSGTIRLAMLKDSTQESVLDTYSGTYPTSLDMTYTVSNDVSQQVWTWKTVGDAKKLLMLSWPHHR